jgi:hypothetical protein
VLPIKKPKCKDCGREKPCVSKQGDAHVWLCEDCEYLRLHHDAPLVKRTRKQIPAEQLTL